jgi:type II secretory pathway component GspD/PulD (secretin)
MVRFAAVFALALALVPAPARGGECKKPSEKTQFKLTFKPDTEIADVIAWYSNVTCTPMLVGTPLAGKKVTILAPEPISLSEVRRLFFDTLDSVGLTVEQSGKLMQVVEARRARPKK